MNNNKKVKTEEEIEVYKKWCLGGLIAIVVIVIIGIAISSDNTTTIETINKNNTTNQTEKTIKKENHFQSTTEYDGIYKFVLNSDNGMGYTFKSVGAISINNGNIKARYLINSNSRYNDVDREHEGFCGLNKEDNLSFYFTLNDEEIEYKCTKTEDGLYCKLMSKYDLAGCYSNELKLLYVGNFESLNTVFNQINEDEKAKEEAEKELQKQREEQEFKNSCQTYTFEQIARNPSSFKDTNVKVTGEVAQVMTDSYSTNLRVNITKKGTYSTYYTDTIYVVYHPQNGEDKILEKDIVTIYGTSKGDCSYTTVFGSTVTLPNIQAKYITIEN